MYMYQPTTKLQGDAQPSDVVTPKKFMNVSGLQTGSITDYAGTSPFHVPYVGGYPGQIRIQLPTGYFEANNPSEQVFIMDGNYTAENIKAGVEIFGLPGTFTAEFAPSKETAQVNATAFNQNGGSYLLLFNAAVPNVNDNLLGLSITFMTSGDASWEYETGKNLDITAMTYKVMIANGELVANQQTIDLGSASMAVDINNADISDGIVSFDIVFTPSAGTFTINNFQPMMSVDIWSY